MRLLALFTILLHIFITIRTTQSYPHDMYENNLLPDGNSDYLFVSFSQNIQIFS